MKKAMMTALAICLMISLTACASKQKKVEQEMKVPINCTYAEGDLRALGHEKAHVVQQIAEGVSAISPAGFVAGLLTRTEKERMRVATGDYNKMVDNRIAEIKEKCGIK